MSHPFRRCEAITRRAILCGVAVLIAGPTWAQSTKIVSVEEHWELRLAQPDADRSAPQTTMFLSPDGDLEGIHFLFTLNHQTVPDYESGGMQVQIWDGDELLQQSAADNVGALAHDEEVVRWVQRLSFENGELTFGVLDGESETWGAFGGDGLSLSVPTLLANLNGYRPGISLAESQVGYAENRVVSLTLTKLVWVTDDGETHEMNAPIAVDTSLDP